MEDELSQSEGQYYDEVEGLYLDGVAKKLRNTEEGKRIAIQEAIAELHEELDPFLPAILKCLSILHVRRGQLVTSDPYGNPVTKGWHDEIDYFIRRNLLKDDSRRLEAMKASDEGSYVGAPYVRLKETIDLVAQYAYHLIPKTSDELTEGKALVWADLEPLEFERRCCESLIAIGWQARITAGSGDQGIDVIATYGNQKLVVQCKRYNGSVGNGAVQEIIAGRSFEKADLATVVSTGSFTRSARELAAAAGVTLIHPSQIAETYGRSPMNPAAGVGSIEPNRFIDYILTEIHLAETRALETAYANYNASDLDSYDDLETHYQQALDILRSTKCASTSMLQRRLRIGYNRAAHVMDIMEEEGIVGPQNGSSPRDILVDLETL